MRKFENCDVLAVLHEIMLHNTKHFQEDFVVDEEILREAAEEQTLWTEGISGCPARAERIA